MPSPSNWEEARPHWEEARPRASQPRREEARPRASLPSVSLSSGFLNKNEAIDIHGVRLPHWNQDDTYVFFTFRLGDSLPQDILEQLKSERNNWIATHPKPWDKDTEYEYHKKFSHKTEEWIDKGFGSCFLNNYEAASIVLATMQHDDGVKYELTDYVIMPNHIHALVRLIGDTRVETLMQEWKSVSSHKLRKQFGTKWCGWMENYFDRTIRDEVHLRNVISYIYKNYCRGGVKIGGRIYEEGIETREGRGGSY